MLCRIDPSREDAKEANSVTYKRPYFGAQQPDFPRKPQHDATLKSRNTTTKKSRTQQKLSQPNVDDARQTTQLSLRKTDRMPVFKSSK